MTMSECRATLTVCTPTDDVVMTYQQQHDDWWSTLIPDGMAVVREGDLLKRLDVTVLTCEDDDPHHTYAHYKEDASGADWTDGTPGAASHADNTPPDPTQSVRNDSDAAVRTNWPAVTDAEGACHVSSE